MQATYTIIISEKQRAALVEMLLQRQRLVGQVNDKTQVDQVFIDCLVELPFTDTDTIHCLAD